MTDHRRAVATLFFLNGAVLASWVPHIPAVQMRLGLGESALGIALLGMAAGALLAIPLAGWAIPRLGSRMVVRASGLLFCAALLAPLLAADLPHLIAALMLFGGANGAMDVAMNAQAVAVERRLQRPIMSWFHGMWSVGGLTGAALAALALYAGLSPIVHAIAAALIAGGGCALAMRTLLPPAEDVHGDGPRLARPGGTLLALGLLAALALLAEGAMGDWSAVYLRRWLLTSASVAALGFAAFQTTMAAGRFAGDRLAGRLGDALLLSVSAALAATALAVALLVGHPLAAVLGCAAVGLGLSNVIPVLFRTAALVPGVAASQGIAAVGSAGYVGFLGGPPLIGLAAEWLGLPVALGLVVIALALIATSGARIGRALTITP
ncbi:MAG TPA: MFS transporter [Candidatus Dormibacteraeota bacterium]|nr:MFS transporter [Candidatus Dormibacteraeota bacterium]